MANTTYECNGRIGPWSSGRFMIYEVGTPDEGKKQILDISTSSYSYHPDPAFLAEPLRQGRHVCYYGTFSAQSNERGTELELRVAPPVNDGYKGLKRLDDFAEFDRAIMTTSPQVNRIHRVYVPPDQIKGEIPFPKAADPIVVKKKYRY